MDYEKAYRSVLQTATQWIKDGCTDKEKICLECVFPELRESEDERIRKEMVDYFSQYKDDGIRGVDITPWIAYLEKQKESLHISETQCGDNRFEIIDKAKRDIIAKTNIESSPDEMKVLDSFLFRAWQMGWLGKYDVIVPEQKPAEWSEEDEKIIQSLILEVNKYVFFAGIEANKIVSFLKSLRPSWKPSEEQMDALKELIDDAKRAGWVTPGATELYEQLKKLTQKV